MQELQFETTWNKSISIKDRTIIEEIFKETSTLPLKNIHFYPIRETINHKGDLLVTVLIHNFTDNKLIFHDQSIVYYENEIIVAEHTFTILKLVVPPNTSMPWTFIFPAANLYTQVAFQNGRLEII